MKKYVDVGQCITDALEIYFEHLEGEAPNAIYNMVIRRVEKPMIALVLEKTKGNQSLAAAYLGINRNTLRKKMQEYQLLEVGLKKLP